jgi:hypothetical protein
MILEMEGQLFAGSSCCLEATQAFNPTRVAGEEMSECGT